MYTYIYIYTYYLFPLFLSIVLLCCSHARCARPPSLNTYMLHLNSLNRAGHISRANNSVTKELDKKPNGRPAISNSVRAPPM